MKTTKKTNSKPILANALSVVVTATLSSAANSRCAFVYHQPKHPMDVKKFRKF